MTDDRTMRVVVLSSTEFGARCIREGVLPAHRVELAGVLTTPREIKISYAANGVEIRTHVDFDEIGRAAGCEVVTLPTPIRGADYVEPLTRLRPDLLLVLGWYYNIPASVREMAPTGCVGIHASLLPRFRGGAPIPWAIIEGATETGVTLFHFEDAIDAGDIVAQRAFPIERHDTCGTVYEKATDASVRILREELPRFASGTASRTPQDESLATVHPQRSPADGEIDWSWSAERIRNFIRAQTRPYPGAFTVIKGKKVTIWDADVVDLESSADTSDGGEG